MTRNHDSQPTCLPLSNSPRIQRLPSIPLRDSLPPNLITGQVLELMTWCRSTLYLRMADTEGPFPRPVRLGPRRVVWRRDEVLEYLDTQVEARDAAEEQRRRYLA